MICIGYTSPLDSSLFFPAQTDLHPIDLLRLGTVPRYNLQTRDQPIHPLPIPIILSAPRSGLSDREMGIQADRKKSGRMGRKSVDVGLVIRERMGDDR